MKQTKKKESSFQSKLKQAIDERYPGCVITKQDPTYMWGIPDLLIVYKDKWAMLETKRATNAHHQALQDYWENKLNEMSYSSFVCPENMEEVLHELDKAFGLER
jgi:hypothetical protein